MKQNQRKFIVALLKAEMLDILGESSFEPREYNLVQKMKESKVLRSLRVDRTKHGKVLLVWDSGDQTIACHMPHVDKDGFDFTNIRCYYPSTKEFSVAVSARFDADSVKGKIIAEEVKEIKKLIVEYDENLAKLFY